LARRGELAGAAALSDDELEATLVEAVGRGGDARAGALAVIARVGPPRALEAHAGAFTPLARLAMARALAGAPAAVPLVAALLADDDPEVAHAALRTALAV